MLYYYYRNPLPNGPNPMGQLGPMAQTTPPPQGRVKGHGCSVKRCVEVG